MTKKASTLEKARALPPLDSLGPDVLLETDTAAAYLALQPKTLRNWVDRTNAPLRAIKIGSCVRYRAADLQGLIRQQTAGQAA